MRKGMLAVALLLCGGTALAAGAAKDKRQRARQQKAAQHLLLWDARDLKAQPALGVEAVPVDQITSAPLLLVTGDDDAAKLKERPLPLDQGDAGP